MIDDSEKYTLQQCTNQCQVPGWGGRGGEETQGILTFSGRHSQVSHHWAPSECQIFLNF